MTIDDRAVSRVLTILSDIGPEIANAGRPDRALEVITRHATTVVPSSACAGITRATNSGFETVAPTDQLTLRVDAIQYELASGPCVDAALTDAVFRAGDLRQDPRWPEFGARAAEQTGVLSMLSFRMFFEDVDHIAALNLYAVEPDAFDSEDELAGLAITTFGALAVTSARRQERITNLERALESNRDIGVAIGVLMGLHRVTREEAFDLLRLASQARHRKLVDIAHDVAQTGSLDIS
ncbi:MAG TPA: GAF and ANTAR domain-containing protein [Jatrophihabitans sp.]|jgi:hypothetical protein|uniref:GAF and ANTAR domain-containing protein n=1 Tax=Jatrophihabitans sp. TaxID=1932789 RepID=UPI002E0BBE19|nr:GAF and ANTAR domain-containing protein [Jatrophihabitans sp.]